jgi:hypothetical protein
MWLCCSASAARQVVAPTKRLTEELEWQQHQANPLSSPWLYAGAKGRGPRSRGQLDVRRDMSKYLTRDSPRPNEVLIKDKGAVLTGTSWHSLTDLSYRNASYGSSAGTACERSCGSRGVCVASLPGAVKPFVRCDCAPYAWGEACAVPVHPPKRNCVRNDSAPWLCDLPLCVFETGEMHQIGSSTTVCRGKPPMGCSGRGTCGAVKRGKCECFPGFKGNACQKMSEADCLRNCSGHGTCENGFCLCEPPFFGVDCSLSPGATIVCTARPCVYVYELPARMNVLSRKAYASWRLEGDFKYRAPMLMLEALLDSKHRTSEPQKADYFFVPVWEWEGCWGPNEGIYRAHRYVSTLYPFWNNSAGMDHIWMVSRDGGTCDTAWGSMREELGASIVLVHWGGVTGIEGTVKERCYLKGQDLVIPASVRSAKTLLSPFWDGTGRFPRTALLPPRPARTTQLFFIGAMCWRTMRRERTMANFVDKCNKSWHGGGKNNPVARYSFGHRWTIWSKYRNLPGFKILATDFPPSLEAINMKRLDGNAEMLRSRYCLCPSGTGWGMRAVHSIILGCVPVVVQHDGEHEPVAQAFEHDLLNWDEFAVIVKHEQVRTPSPAPACAHLCWPRKR